MHAALVIGILSLCVPMAGVVARELFGLLHHIETSAFQTLREIQQDQEDSARIAASVSEARTTYGKGTPR